MFKTIRKCFRLIGIKELEECFAELVRVYQEYKERRDLEIAVKIEVMEKERARTIAQNSLYWAWVTIIAEDSGLTKDEQHTILKRSHLARIYTRDDSKFAEMALHLRRYREVSAVEEYESLAIGVARLMSTTKANTKQMTEYLKDIDRHYFAQGLVLPKPDDYMWIMGEGFYG